MVTSLSCGGGGSGDGPTAPGGSGGQAAVLAATITLSRDSVTLVPGAVSTLTATAKDSSGQTLNRTITWTSSDTTRAKVVAGTVSGIAAGSVTIQASADTKTAVAQVTIKDGGVAGPAAASITAIGGRVTLALPANALAQITDITASAAASATADPRLLPGTAVDLGPIGLAFAQPVSLTLKYDPTKLPPGSLESALGIFLDSVGAWRSLPGGTVNTTAKTVTATIAHFSTYAILAPLAPFPVATVAVTPNTSTLQIGGTTALVAVTTDSSGHVVTGRTILWASLNDSVASVSSTGTVTAVAPGQATISATSEGKVGTAAITVMAPPAASVAASSVAAGYGLTCALTPGGKAYCWGLNRNGSVGNGQTGSSVPILIPTAVVGGHTFKAIFAGSSSPSNGAIVCALDNIGRAYCWGPVFNTIGPGNNASLGTPTLISPTLTFSTLSVGATHVCGISADQSLYCWGSNNYGELLNGSPGGDGSTTPVRAMGNQSVTSVAAGASFTCVVTGAPQVNVFCGGVDNWNQLGSAPVTQTCYTFACSPTPVVLSGANVIRSVTAGYDFACGLTPDHVTYCWGHNGSGQLGQGQQSGSNDVRPDPQIVQSGAQFQTLSAGEAGACGLPSTGYVYCWGDNSSQSPQGSPSTVSGGPALKTLSTGAEHACGADSQGQLWCWGGNTYGELGDGTTNAHNIPAVVPNLTVLVP